MVVIPIILLSVYLGTVIYRYKTVPDSISGTVYMHHQPLLFMLTMWGIAFFTMVSILDRTIELQWLAFLSTAALFGVGCTPLYRTEGGVVHYGCAVVSGLGTQIVVAANEPSLLWVWCALPACMLIRYIRCLTFREWLFWVQMTCIIITFTYCLS